MPFTPVNALEELLVAAARDPAARPAFYRALTQHSLFVITDDRVPERERSVKFPAGTNLKIRTIDYNGNAHVPVFTSVERISAVVPAKVGYVSMQGQDILNLLRGKDLVVNPGADYGKTMTPPELDSILDGSIFRPDQSPDVSGKEIILGQPKKYPRELTLTLSRLFAKSPKVRAAYLAHAFMPDVDKAPHTLIGLEVDGDWQTVVEEAGLVVRELAATDTGEIVDFVPIRADQSSPIADYMRHETSPFYKRKRWFGFF